MHRLQEVVRLHRLGRSSRVIARQLSMGRNTLRSYLDALVEAGILDGAADELPGFEVLRKAVERHFPVKEAPQQSSSVERWRPRVAALRSKGAGPKAIYDWLFLHEEDFKGSLSAIKRLCLRLEREEGPKPTAVAIPVETEPGEVAQVDFVYAKKRYDPSRGELRRSWLFVMTLGFSRRMYLQLVFDQRIETWCRLHVEAFEYFGGVPHVVVPDNLKSAVIRGAFGASDEAILNRTFRELARHYGFQIDPTPPRSPEKKGKVERSGGYVKRNFMASWESVDIDEDRRQLRRWNEEIAAVRVHGTTSRKPIELFEESEREALLPLPRARWERVVWKQARVHRDAHVQIDYAFYSVPWRFLGQKLWVRSTAHSVALFKEGEHLCTHPRVKRGKRSTVEGHLPEHRSDLRHRSRSYWIKRARSIGPEVRDLASFIFDSDDVLHQLRKVQAVVRHLESFPRERACAAARRALHFGCADYRSIKGILRKGLDLEPIAEAQEERAWSRGSRFARKPTETLFAIKEKTHGTH